MTKYCINRRALTVLLASTMLLAGCLGTAALNSNTFVKPAAPITALKVLYVQNNLVGNRGGTASLSGIGYESLPKLLEDRVPLVLGLNKISAQFNSIQKIDGVPNNLITGLKWGGAESANAPLLTIQIINGTVLRAMAGGATDYHLTMQVTLFDSTGRTMLWTGQFKNMLSIAMLGVVKFDNDFVDKMLKTVLEKMASDEIIKLASGNAIIPASATAVR